MCEEFDMLIRTFAKLVCTCTCVRFCIRVRMCARMRVHVRVCAHACACMRPCTRAQDTWTGVWQTECNVPHHQVMDSLHSGKFSHSWEVEGQKIQAYTEGVALPELLNMAFKHPPLL